jgi:hypothetical protein
MSGLYRDGAKQGTQTLSPAPRLIPAETENQPRTNIETGTASGGTSESSKRIEVSHVTPLPVCYLQRFSDQGAAP